MSRYVCWNHDKTIEKDSDDHGVTCPDCGAVMTYCDHTI